MSKKSSENNRGKKKQDTETQFFTNKNKTLKHLQSNPNF